MRPADTSPQAWEVYLGLVRKMPPEERMRRALELSEEVRRAAEAGLRLKYPRADEREIALRRARLELGPELFAKAFGGETIPDE
jgi:hypothetical protein